MIYKLPTSLTVGGAEYEIRSDYRAALDICAALSDAELSDDDRGEAILSILYTDLDAMPPEHYNEAIEKCFWFLNCGKAEQQKNTPKLMDWEQDFDLIVSPVNRVLGYEIRAIEYMHWWTFISAYNEIGSECAFAQVVGIRSKKVHGKKLDKSEQDFYHRNRELVDFKSTYTEKEDELLKQWGAG